MARKLRQRQQFSDRFEKEDARQSNAQTWHVMPIGRRRTREVAAYHSAIRKEHGERRMPIDKERDYAVEVQDRRAGKEIRNVRLQGCPVRQQHEIRQKKGDKREKARRRSSEPSLLEMIIGVISLRVRYFKRTPR